MAYAHSTAATVAMASPGYGKRTAGDQPRRRADDFGHLPPREAAIAAYIDRLPEGAAMDVKSLARDLAAYGQMAVRTALNRLSAAGHLRRVRERAGEDRTRWVFRTYFSRVARSDAWWARFLDPGTPNPAAADEAAPGPEESAAYAALADAGRTDPRMMLSARECADLAPYADEWLARGATPQEVVRALTVGLPVPVHAPAALARRRLVDKLPPVRHPTGPPRPALLECTECGVPGRPEALPGGLCRPCRTPPPATVIPAPAAPTRVRPPLPFIAGACL